MTEKIRPLPLGVRLGVSPLSWANDVLEDLGADISLETCLDEARAAGYEGVELGRKFPRDVASLRPLLDSRALFLASGWYNGELAARAVDDEFAAVADHAQLLRAMGCGVMVYGEVAMMAPGAPLDLAMSRRVKMSDAEVSGYADRLDEFSRRLFAEYGLKLAYHHHLMMVVETFDEISRLMDRTSAHVGLLLDTGHAVAAGFSYERLIERFGTRIVHIHLKDVRAPVMKDVWDQDRSFNAGVRNGMFTVPGDGSIDFSCLAAFVKRGGYRGWIVVEAEQDPVLAPPLPAVRRAFRYIETVFGE